MFVRSTLWRFLPQHLKYIQARHIWDGTDLFRYLYIPNISGKSHTFGWEVWISLHLGGKYLEYLTIMFFNTVEILAAQKQVFGIVCFEYCENIFSAASQFHCFQFAQGRTGFSSFSGWWWQRWKWSGEVWWWWWWWWWWWYQMVIMVKTMSLKIRFLPALQQLRVFSLFQSSSNF